MFVGQYRCMSVTLFVVSMECQYLTWSRMSVMSLLPLLGWVVPESTGIMPGVWCPSAVANTYAPMLLLPPAMSNNPVRSCETNENQSNSSGECSSSICPVYTSSTAQGGGGSFRIGNL